MRHKQSARAVEVVPLRLVLAVAVEHLYPVVLSVGDIDPAIGIGADVVHDVELPGVGAGLAPRHQQFPVGRIFVDARIAVAVGHIDVAVRGQRGMGAAVERLAAHIGRRLAGNAELEQHLAAVQPAFADKMPAIIGQVDRLVWAHMDAMRPRVLPLAPGAQEVAVAVKHHHRVFAPVEAVDVVVIVDADCRHLLE